VKRPFESILRLPERSILLLRKSTKVLLVSRGDSTLRGHFPEETEALKSTLEGFGTIRFDGEIIIPFFKEGGRYTLNNVHYVKDSVGLVPVSRTEFASDKSFGFVNSHLGAWVEEKHRDAITVIHAFISLLMIFVPEM